MTTSKPVRGRPKTFDREHVLAVAMMRYWAEGPTTVSVNDICTYAGVSKPSLYREFGNEDGLKRAALATYLVLALGPIFDLLKPGKTFAQGLNDLIAYLMQDRTVLGLPPGCLHFDMCQCGNQLGELTVGTAEFHRQETLNQYESWIERAKEDGEFKADMPTKTAALYVDAQIGAAMKLQKQGVQSDVIETCLRVALTALV